MSDNEFDSSEIRRIDQEAADWVAKKIGGFTAEEQDRFFDWLSADPRHCDWYAKHQKTWKDLDLLAQWMPEHSDKSNMDLLKYREPSRVWFWLGGVAAALAVGLLAFQFLKLPGSGDVVMAQNLVASHYESHLLPDGSTVELNQGAALKVDYSKEFRRVNLVSSEAHFHVAKDATRPFIVGVRGMEIRAVGTAFNVRLKEESVQVVVTEGRVQLASKISSDPTEGSPREVGSPEPFTIELDVGEMSEVPFVSDAPMGDIKVVSLGEMNKLLSWKPQMFEFDSAPLSEVVRVFNDHNNAHLVLGDERLAAIPIVASFRSANVDHFVELLELSMGLRYERQGDKIVLYFSK